MPKGGFMDPVLFRSATCPNTNGKVCNGNGVCGTEYNPWSALDIINCKCYDGSVTDSLLAMLFSAILFQDGNTKPIQIIA